MDKISDKALFTPIVIFHIGGGDEDIGPSEALLNLKDVDIELYVFKFKCMHIIFDHIQNMSIDIHMF